MLHARIDAYVGRGKSSANPRSRWPTLAIVMQQSGREVNHRWLADTFVYDDVCRLFEPMLSSRESWGKLRDGPDVEKAAQFRADEPTANPSR